MTNEGGLAVQMLSSAPQRMRARENRRDGELDAFKVARALNDALGKTYDNLTDEYHLIRETMVKAIAREDAITEDYADYMVSRTIQAMRRLILNTQPRGAPPVSLPAVASELVLSALEVLAEPLDNGRGIQAYRNRRREFIQTLAEFGEDAAGGPSRHRDFYAELGRTVAAAVLEHDLLEAPALSPSSFTYDAIKKAALEQLVYFIGVGSSGPIKIGIAAEPISRLATLQTAHHEKLELLGITVGGREQEAAYHAQFAASRLNGEWFERTSELLAEIARLKAPTLSRTTGDVL